ncbi:MAG: hypothetical protein GY854_19530 [Deltaproteobacteria bacterium]|nr:hypothetical protein [Deltaproteobacteria bacterium]
MDSNAPGQFLGYAIQVPRALVHLLKGRPGDTVCVEVLGDVATVGHDGNVTAEEDKSSVVANPVTNRSTDLWKTFYNWANAVDNGHLKLETTRFILYCNRSGREGIVNAFHAARTEEDARDAIERAMTELDNIDEGHDIWKFYDYVVNQKQDVLVGIVQRFEFEIGSGDGTEEVRAEVVRKHFPTAQIDGLVESISGWLYEELTKRIAAGKPARIKWEDFDKHLKVLFDRSRRSELIDFTLRKAVPNCDVQEQIENRPCFIRQLDVIDLECDEVVESVIEFLRAKVNRDKWIEFEIIDEDVASEFEEALLRFWANQKTRIQITEKSLAPEEQGKLLLTDCRNRQVAIRDMWPPESTIAGTYHAMADEPLIGWHPDWRSFFVDDPKE